jgi:hypothetical protein
MDGVQTRLDGAIDKGYISKILRLALLAPALSTLSSQGERIRGAVGAAAADGLDGAAAAPTMTAVADPQRVPVAGGARPRMLRDAVKASEAFGFARFRQ